MQGGLTEVLVWASFHTAIGCHLQSADIGFSMMPSRYLASCCVFLSSIFASILAFAFALPPLNFFILLNSQGCAYPQVTAERGQNSHESVAKAKVAGNTVSRRG
jgi:hypothetical protein